MYHNCYNTALISETEVIIYFAYGRGPKGSILGKLFLLEDTFILGIEHGNSLSYTPVKRQEIEINKAWEFCEELSLPTED